MTRINSAGDRTTFPPPSGKSAITKTGQLKKSLKKFPKGLEIIKSIESTFRTETGKEYGPEMIAQGINIGSAIYEKLVEYSKDPKYLPQEEPERLL